MATVVTQQHHPTQGGLVSYENAIFSIIATHAVLIQKTQEANKQRIHLFQIQVLRDEEAITCWWKKAGVCQRPQVKGGALGLLRHLQREVEYSQEEHHLTDFVLS